MSQQDDLFSAYNGTYGSVQREGSITRELTERESGKMSRRAELVLKVLYDTHGALGATWEQLGADLALHHGQISGVLSNLHKRGLIFCLAYRVNNEKSHRYIHNAFRDFFPEDKRIDTPVQTKAGKRKAALERVLAELREIDAACDSEWGGGFYEGRINDIIVGFDKAVQDDK
jgi:hypothetical protein